MRDPDAVSQPHRFVARKRRAPPIPTTMPATAPVTRSTIASTMGADPPEPVSALTAAARKTARRGGQAVVETALHVGDASQQARDPVVLDHRGSKGSVGRGE